MKSKEQKRKEAIVRAEQYFKIGGRDRFYDSLEDYLNQFRKKSERVESSTT